MGFTPLFGPQRQRNHDQPKTLEQASSQPDPAAAKAPQRSGAEAPLHNERNVALLSHARGAASLNNSLKAFHRDASLLAALPKRPCMQTLAQEPLYRWVKCSLRVKYKCSFETCQCQKASTSCCWCSWPAVRNRRSQHIACEYAACCREVSTPYSLR